MYFFNLTSFFFCHTWAPRQAPIKEPLLQVHPPQLMVSLTACSYFVAVRTPWRAAWNAPGKPEKTPTKHTPWTISNKMTISSRKEVALKQLWLPQEFMKTDGINSWGAFDKFCFTWLMCPEQKNKHFKNTCKDTEYFTHVQFKLWALLNRIVEASKKWESRKNFLSHDKVLWLCSAHHAYQRLLCPDPEVVFSLDH